MPGTDEWTDKAADDGAARSIRLGALFCLACLVVLAVAQLLLADALWWTSPWFGWAEGYARHLVEPFRYLLEHPPTIALAVGAGGIAAVVLFFFPVYEFLRELEHGPWGMRRTRRPSGPPTWGQLEPSESDDQGQDGGNIADKVEAALDMHSRAAPSSRISAVEVQDEVSAEVSGAEPDERDGDPK